jgi:alkylated DNA repair dioxygenase AlkB
MPHLHEQLDGFTRHQLDETHAFYSGILPEELRFDEERRTALWEMHPEEYHTIMMVGRPVQTPRWQQAYGADYTYTGNVNKALPVPDLLAPLLHWARENMYPALNGVLLNWYDAELAHYIGAHRDSIVNMIEGAPIVTISLGEERVFRLRPWKGKGMRDFPAPDGRVFIMPWETNRAYTHEVPHFAHYRERRISITIRAFHEGHQPEA